MSKPNPAPIVLATMARDLISELSDDQFLRSLSRLRKEREWISVKAIIELSGSAEEDGRPGVEAAWAMCPRTEESSVVWTSEMAEAFALCRPLLMNGDEIGARMVFKEQYPAIVSRARVNHIAARWSASLGWNKGDRVRALAEAVEKKRLEPKHALGLLGPEQRDEFLLQLPTPERKLLAGATEKPNLRQLSGFQKVLVKLRDEKAMPDSKPEPSVRFANGNAVYNRALTQARALAETGKAQRIE